MKTLRTLLGTLLLLSATAPVAPLHGQESSALQAARRVDRLEARPARVRVGLGESAPLDIVALDAEGRPVEGVELRVFGRGTEWAAGAVTGTDGGEGLVIASLVVPPDFGGEPPSVRVPVEVTWPAITRVDVATREEGRLYAGTSVRHRAAAFHADGSPRPGATFAWSSSDPSVAEVDASGIVTAHRAGRVTIHVDSEGARGSLTYDVPAFPARSLEIRGGETRARTGDVVRFEAVARDAQGRPVPDLPLVWSTRYVPDDTIHAPGASGLVEDGSFVGEQPGQYWVVASAGDLVARSRVDVRPRNAVRPVEPMGQGSVSDVHTSDLWVFEGVDGRDYALTGTWGGDGWAYVWDVTDPASPTKTDSIKVDARTVNDVKVSPDGRWGALSREGASNRRNGVVILDLADPAHPVVASTYDDGLTGGVHNMFATEDHLFALSGGDKYVILDMGDLRNPRYVSEYDHPDSRIHDVWVHDGVAYSSEWQNGVVVVDVGHGRWGGSLENPVFVTNVPYPVGATHAAFPYVQESTGKVYLFLGDEIMSREGAAWSGAGLGRVPEKGGTPSVTRGYVHVIDFTDPENPKDVARYEVPEFGTHNMWVEDDLLYVAYYEGGVRVVDVSGELMGNLADQGREVAVFKAFDPDGFAPNAPMAWGPQPFKGHLFFSDFNSGLWSVRIQPEPRPVS
ncbi:MAG: Ig-like domain-containing protein [Gemmatimonadetes bacterium]|nr:Ig-like domain-containing protein [Gemmatimonadota bacterium]